MVTVWSSMMTIPAATSDSRSAVGGSAERAIVGEGVRPFVVMASSTIQSVRASSGWQQASQGTQRTGMSIRIELIGQSPGACFRRAGSERRCRRVSRRRERDNSPADLAIDGRPPRDLGRIDRQKIPINTLEYPHPCVDRTGALPVAEHVSDTRRKFRREWSKAVPLAGPERFELESVWFFRTRHRALHLDREMAGGGLEPPGLHVARLATTAPANGPEAFARRVMQRAPATRRARGLAHLRLGPPVRPHRLGLRPGVH